MGEEGCVPADTIQYGSAGIMSPEIVEIGEDSTLVTGSRDASANDVYVAVGKDDLHVLKWALDHAVSPGAGVFLIHVFPPITYIKTPVGKLSRSQVSHEQLRFYLNEENNRRRRQLQKYTRLCLDSKVTVDTMLLESNSTAKAILELIPVLNISNLVIGAKRPPSSRWRRKKPGKGEFIKEHAPDHCEVTIVHEGKKVADKVEEGREQQVDSSRAAAATTRRHSGRKVFECVCFPGMCPVENRCGK